MTDTSNVSRYCNSLPGLNRLMEVTRILAAEIDTAHALESIAIEAVKALHCDRAVIYQFDAKRNVLFATAGTQHELIVPLGQGLAGYVARQRQLVNIADAPRDPRWHAAYDQLDGYETQTVLAAPLVAAGDGRLLGVLEMLNNIGGPFDQDDESLALAFSQHAAATLDRARLIAEIHQRRELDASLNAAREVQRRFMPSKLPPIDGYEVANWWFPYEAVGGDYCDVIPLPSGDVALCVADVSGHGLGPSLLMASVRAALRTLLLSHTSPQELLEKLALALAEDFEHGSFITMCLTLLAPQRHELSFSNAGHAPALVYQAASGKFVELESTGLPLGVIVPMEYPLGPSVPMQPGDLMILATDGIVESFDKRGEQFGVQRLKQLIVKLARSPIQDVVRSIGREVEQHYVGDSPPDDLTVLSLRRK
ncbi:MAG: SpoIIE family protein phosphatase [Planctomycetaceae bacterium]|nr:SpoIIE family protein phosphatase [Planctomycetaceae bacterium]